MTPRPELKQLVLAAARNRPSRTRAQGRLFTRIAYAVAGLAAVGAFEAWGGLAHSAGRPLRYTLAIAAGCTAIAVLATRCSIARSKALAGRPLGGLLLVVLAAPIATLLWMWAWHGTYLEPFARTGYRCLAQGLSTGAVLLATTLMLRKRMLANNAAATGAAMGAASAALAGVFVALWCPLTNAPHVVVGHVAPILALSCIGAALGHAVLVPVGPRDRGR
jgi:hypothetical protein